MKPKNPRPHAPFTRLHALAVAATSLAVPPAFAATWVGDTSQNWNTAANWDSDPANPTGVFNINTATVGVFPIISADSAFTPTDIIIGAGAGMTGRVNQTGGIVSTGTGNTLHIGRDGGTGTYDQTAGILNAGAVRLINTAVSGTATLNIAGTVNSADVTSVFDGSNASVTGQGILNVNTGGTLNTENDLLVSFAGSGSGEVNIAAGATINVATTTKRWMVMNYWDTTQGRLIVDGGTLNLNANTDLQFSPGSWGPGASQGSSSITLNSGAINSWSGNQSGAGFGVINLNNNGTSAGINNTFHLNGGTLTISAIVSGQGAGSRVFNFNGGTLKPTASNAGFFGAGAASTANVRDGGAVIDTGGFNVTIAKTLDHSIIGGDNATDGGLTKNGLGILSLAGVNTYSGNTTVNAGQLTLADNASIKFVPTTVGVTNKITGTGTVQLDGDFAIDTTGASTMIGHSWTLVDVGTLTETYGPTFTVVGWTEVSAGVWHSPVAPFFRFRESTGVLSAIDNTDSDGDGLDDLWEDRYFGDNDGIIEPSDLTQDGSTHDDNDGYDNLAEFTANTDPTDPAFTPANIDGDGLDDLWEDQYFGDGDMIVESSDITPQSGTGDPDGDLANNLAEFTNFTEPNNGASWPDTDAVPDLMNDGWEIHFFGNLSKDGTADTDGDGYTDLQEHDAHTNPTLATGVRVSPIWASLKNRWSFNNTLSDSVGGSTATIVEVGTNNVTLGATTIQMTGGAKANSDYVKLGENLLPKSSTPVTVELWAKQDAIRNWSRIFDFHSGTNEYLMMSWTLAMDNATDRLEFRDGPNPLYMDNLNQPYGITNEHHIVVTLEPLAGALGRTRVSIYSAPSGAADLGAAKGTQETGVNLVNLNDALDALGYSPWDDDTASATYNEVRIWNGALFGWMREKLHDQGPDNAAIPDTENDFLPDAWETQYFNNTTTATSLSGNNDGDAFTNLQEYVAGSNPNSTASTPNDLDGDGYSNADETTAGSSPSNPASFPGEIDADGLTDAWETTHFGNVTAQSGTGDAEGDGTNNLAEYRLGLNPNSGASRFTAVITPTAITWQGKAGVTFKVKTSGALNGWTTISTQAGVEGTNTFPITPSGGSNFYQVTLEP